MGAQGPEGMEARLGTVGLDYVGRHQRLHWKGGLG